MIPTRDHGLIRQWADYNSATPAEIKQLAHDGDPAVLTFIFHIKDAGNEYIYPITWESFFAQFDLMGLSIAFAEERQMFTIVRMEKRVDELLH